MKYLNLKILWILIVVGLFLAPLEVSSNSPSFIKINYPAPFSTTYNNTLEISGTVHGISALSFNGQAVPFDRSGAFKIWVKLLNIGRNDLLFTANSGGRVVSFTLPLIKLKSFSDIAGHPHKNVIETLATLKIFGNLVFEDFFWPETTISRSSYATWLVKSMGVKKPPLPSQSTFKDVTRNNPSFPYIEYAYQNHWLKGSADNYLAPDTGISRGEAVVWLLRALKLVPLENISQTTVKKYHYLAVKKGFYPESWQKAKYNLDFEKPLTRSDAAWLLARTKSVRILYQLLFAERKPLIKEIGLGETTENKEKIINFKVKIQLPEPFFTKPSFDVFLSFIKSSQKSLKLWPEGAISPADELVYIGKVRLPAGSAESLWPCQLNIIDENGIFESQVFPSLSEIQKFNESNKKEGPEFLKITLSSLTYSRSNNQPVLVEVTVNPRNKNALEKIYLNLQNIGNVSSAPAEDDGLLGDKKAGDGVYSILIKPAPTAGKGKKTIPVILEAKNGLRKFENISLTIVE